MNSSNPYQAPADDNPPPVVVEKDTAAWEFPPAVFVVVGILLMICSAISMTVSGFQLAASVNAVRNEGASFTDIEILVFSGIAVVMQIAIFNGALSLVRRDSFNSAWYGSILASVPCFGIFSFPMGVLSLFLLMSHSSRRVFKDHDTDTSD